MSASGDSVDEHQNRLAALVMGAVGVVFGDIGTSPLYAFRECFGHHSLAINQANIAPLTRDSLFEAFRAQFDIAVFAA